MTATPFTPLRGRVLDALAARPGVECVLVVPEEPAILDRLARPHVVAALTAAEVIRQAYPEAAPTYWSVRGVRCSGAKLFAFITSEALQAIVFWRWVEQDRERPWRMLRALGLSPLLAYLFGRLTVAGQR